MCKYIYIYICVYIYDDNDKASVKAVATSRDVVDRGRIISPYNNTLSYNSTNYR